MDTTGLWKKFLNYAKNPVTPSSAGIVAIIKGVFAPFVYVPLSGFWGGLYSERIEPISLFNRGSGIVIILLCLISFALLIKKKYLSALIPAILSVLIVIIETYRVTVSGMNGHQYTSIYDPGEFWPRGPIVEYDLLVRGRLGDALGSLLGGYILLFFSVVSGRNQMKRSAGLTLSTKKSKLRIFFYSILFLLVLSVIVYFFIMASERPIAETHIKGFIDQR